MNLDAAIRKAGLKLTGYGAQNLSCGPCPFCNAGTRHTKSGDKRGAIDVHRSTGQWICRQCDRGGSFYSLLLTCGVRGEVQVEFSGEPKSLPEMPEGTSFGLSIIEEWDGVYEYLEKRHIDPLAINRRALAFTASPESLEAFRVPRSNALAIPLWDANGMLRNVVWRRIDDTPGPKSMTTPGYSARGLVMLNLESATGLFTRHRPRRWWVVEGEIDFLRLCCVNPDDAVIGIRSGSIQRHSRLLDPLENCEVIIATDADKAGNAYANLITASLFDGQMRRGVSIKRADLGG